MRTRTTPPGGSFKDRTHPVPGNHDYHTEGAAGYVDYFGASAVTNKQDGGLYYGWDVGNGWRAYAMNTEISTSGAQLRWLEADIVAHPAEHYLLYTHHPRFTSGKEHGPDEKVCPLWGRASPPPASSNSCSSGTTTSTSGSHRWTAPAGPGADGAPSIVIGSGGERSLPARRPRVRQRASTDDEDFGVLELTLYRDSYAWEFLASGMAGRAGAARPACRNAGEVLDKGSAGV